MGLETGTTINQLNANNPTQADDVGQGWEHLRLIKSTIKTTFPFVQGVMNKSHTQLNDTVTDVEAATSANTASTIVKRDASGNFIAGAVTASLTGDVTGNVSGSSSSCTGNAATATTAAACTGNSATATTAAACTGNAATATKWANSRTITLGGDCSGSVGLDGSADKTLTVTVSNNSHNHTIANVTGLQTALDGKLGSTANAASATKWQTARTLSLGGDCSGSVSLNGTTDKTLTVTVSNNSHNHTIANVTGLQTALDGKASKLDVYPVGSVYLSVDSNFSPSTTFGGTWVEFGSGRMLIGLDTSNSAMNVVEETGGSTSHDHGYDFPLTGFTGTQQSGHLYEPHYDSSVGDYSSNYDGRLIAGSGKNEASENLESIVHAGGGSTHAGVTNTRALSTNNSSGASDYPPFIVVKMWKRTA